MPKYSYSSNALSKISKLAVEGYKSNIGTYSPIRAFFMCNISMRSHFMVKLERDAFERTGSLCYLSSNPFQLCHHHLEVIGKAPLKNIGVLTMPKNIHQITRQRVQSADFAQKQGLFKRISSMLKKVWGE